MPQASQTVAIELRDALGESFALPSVNLSDAAFQIPDLTGTEYALPAAATIEDYTTGAVGGSGYFDKMMSSTKAHLEEQFTKGRITAAEYTKAYIELTTAAMSTATTLLTQKDQARWQTILLQNQAKRAAIEAATAAVNLETAKAQLVAAHHQANAMKAQHVLNLVQAAGESAKYDVAIAQLDLVKEQTESQRAQTLNTRTDGTTAVAGMLGKQKDLYQQQITSYQRDAEQKAAKMWLDSWSLQKSLDEGLAPPTELTNTTLNTVLAKIRTNNALT